MQPENSDELRKMQLRHKAERTRQSLDRVFPDVIAVHYARSDVRTVVPRREKFEFPGIYTNTHGEERSARLLATIIGKASKSIKATSGNFNKFLWPHPLVQEILLEKKDAVNVKLISAQEASVSFPDFITTSSGIQARRLVGLTSHFVLVDDRYWRIEQPHLPDMNVNVRAIVDTGTQEGAVFARSLSVAFETLFAAAE